MEKLRRGQRIAAITKMLTGSPGRRFSYATFCDLFGAAKSTISEDVELCRQTLAQLDLGQVRTLPGAAGGVLYLPVGSPEGDRAFLQQLCRRLEEPGRILPGGYVYMTDILSTPALAERMGNILAAPYHGDRPDHVVTVETRGIPVAMMVARALDVPLLIARRSFRLADGSLVTINYAAGPGDIRTLSLPRRSLEPGQKTLIIDDVLKGGGTLYGLSELMEECGVTVAGIGVVAATCTPASKRVPSYRALLTLDHVDEEARTVSIRPAL